MSILEIENISKAYTRKVVNATGKEGIETNAVVNKLSLNLPTGKISFLVGGNGAGKTTLFNVIQGYLKPNEGNIRYFSGDKSIDLTRQNSYDLQKLKIGRLFQDKLVYKNLSLIENMLQGLAFSKIDTAWSSIFRNKKGREEMEINKQKARVIWHELLEDNNFFAEREHELAGNLSYGQQRILAICRLMMYDYSLILMDEPTAGLNEKVIEVLQKVLRKIKNKGLTLFIIEHNMEFVRSLADFVFVMEYGELSLQGECGEVFNTTDFKKNFLEYA